MITKISKIKNFGIYHNYANDFHLQDFNRYNLFYGWNGSGKSTLSKLFQCIENKEQCSDYSESEWEIQTDNGTIDQVNIKDNTLNIRVFNK